MTYAELVAELMAAHAKAGDLIYVERRGDEYRWQCIAPGANTPLALAAAANSLPDAWLCYTGGWPPEGAQNRYAFIEDLLAEMESMVQSGDRCRWPLNQPWPSRH
jgi:hypothetical protein